MTAADRVPAPLLVLAGIVSVQFGGALAATLIPHIGAAGSVTMRLLFASVILCAVVRPRLRGYSAAAWRTVILFGLALGLMNFAFYGSLAHLPIGVAVTIEFIGPLLLSAVLSRRPSDYVAVAGAAVGVVLISEALHVPLDQLSWAGILLALTAGACWAAYIILSGRTGAAFPKLDGLAIAMLIATCFVAPFGLATVGDWSAPLLAKGLGIAVLSSLLPYSLELIALRRMSAAVFGILLSLEPACAALAGLLVLGQRLHVWQLLGMALVVGASILIMGGGGTEKDPAEAAAT
ncbi:EamA family transporter [Nostocoides australiense]|uniref:Putative integral membrane protein n=1 Tax=Nostocoides australiense Ben110 TaxID=1193182 RepID=W6JWH1_9MICO|nr:EamA family transporter [Tetrasphaera australiensis]MCA0290923.1 EamA family transporter [Actinomycetota bacterium]CCH73908.1 putative integral membrane protein [Tetrasphaera australiensis Ben110]HPF80745.1 EamA family transporter [Tetrasphaera australiensis]HRW01453.1 EamA family transporter [Tetrasphaera sp.]